VLRVAEVPELAQVEPRREDAPRARDDDGLHGLVADEPVDRVADLVAERDREGVLLFGPGEDDGRDAGVVDADADGVRHGVVHAPGSGSGTRRADAFDSYAQRMDGTSCGAP